jgi:cysteinyl-tRNA synthetase
MVSNVLKEHSPDALRIYLLQHHYRQAWEYQDDGPARAEPLVRRLREAEAGPTLSGSPFAAEPYRARFLDAMDDDLDTPRAIDVLLDLSSAIRSAHAAGHDTAAAREMIRELGELLGLRLGSDRTLLERRA